jgi:hypothetical protein
VRVARLQILGALALAVAALFAAPARAQDQTEVLMPEQSAAKAKELIRAAVQAMGGSAYLGVKDVTCTGRLGQFGHNGDTMGYEKFIDYSKLPDKDRNENLPKRNIIEVLNGDKGWLLDRGGVSDAAEDTVSQFQEDQKVDIDSVLRERWKEPNVILRYLGPDIVDLKEADWIEFVDPDNRSVRIAFSKFTHLPIRKTVVTRDPTTHLKAETMEYYSNYHPVQGVTTPFQITREKNGHRVYQVFFSDCKYNTNPADSLFSKESLDQRWAQVGKNTIRKQEKQKAKDAKDAQNGNGSDSDKDNDKNN